MDFATTEEVLRAYGDMVKDAMRQVLGPSRKRGRTALRSAWRGLDEFDIDDFSGELEDAKNLLALGIQSPTLTKQVFKNIALKYLNDARPEIKNKVAEEIEREVT